MSTKRSRAINLSFRSGTSRQFISWTQSFCHWSSQAFRKRTGMTNRMDPNFFVIKVLNLDASRFTGKDNTWKNVVTPSLRFVGRADQELELIKPSYPRGSVGIVQPRSPNRWWQRKVGLQNGSRRCLQVGDSLGELRGNKMNRKIVTYPLI